MSLGSPQTEADLSEILDEFENSGGAARRQAREEARWLAELAEIERRDKLHLQLLGLAHGATVEAHTSWARDWRKTLMNARKSGLLEREAFIADWAEFVFVEGIMLGATSKKDLHEC